MQTSNLLTFQLSNVLTMKQIRFYSLFVFALFAGTGLAWGDVYRVNRKSQWEQWQFPAGTLELRTDGSITPRKFEEGAINAARNAAQFSHKAEGGIVVQGGVRKAGSNPARGGNIIDGNALTYWKPDADARLEDWWIEIDLGRGVPVTKIRLIFPDREGARPFREFRVFGSDGRRVVVTGEDIFSFNLIAGTVRPNDHTEVEYEVRPVMKHTVLAIGEAPTLAEAESGVGSTGSSGSYSFLQYIRFRADAKSRDAALSEVEVYTFGENIALETFARGGSIVERVGRGSAMIDGDANTSWIGRSHPEEERPTWVLDLGVLFWIERIALFGIEGSQIYGFVSGIQNHQFLGSDGRLKLTGAISYDLLSDFDVDSGHPGQLTYLFSPPRPIRYLSSVFMSSQSGEIAEVTVFPVGHIAQVELTSGNIDLGKIAGDHRPKAIRSIGWEADLPPGTRVQVQTRSGNALQEVTLYFHRNGKEISEVEYNKLPKSLRGKMETLVQQGEDWSNWSMLYQVSGEEFRSPSPRRYVQVRLLLSSDRVTAAPTLRALSIDFTDALLARSAGEISPKTALPGIPRTFSYRILPKFEAGDPGFNRILFETPSLVDAESLFVRIADREVEPASMRISADSLVVELPRVVRRDAVEVDLRLIVLQNPTLFRAFLGNTRRAGLWQSVDPAERFATTVFLPAVPETDRLIARLSIQPRTITPNGDGVGDQAEIRFFTLKVEKPPKVRIYALNGALIRELEGMRGSDGFYLYAWSGKDRSGGLVPPGIYLCQIGVGAQAGEGTLFRTISVVY